MVTRHIELTDEQNRLLEEIAVHEGKSISELVRAGVDELLRNERGRLRDDLRQRAAALSGRYRSGLQDLSTEHDRYLDDAFRG
jgi:Arc/MetJ-type ribon-helix-helix transcriptional regulator